MKFYKYSLIFLLLPLTIFGSPKQISCSYSNSSDISSESNFDPSFSEMYAIALPIGQRIRSSKEFCIKYPDMPAHIADYCGEAKKFMEMKNSCLASPELPKYTFILDTKELNTGNAINGEFTLESCGEYMGEFLTYFQTDVEKLNITSTPTVISIENAANKFRNFNIDRKTLKAGYGSSRLLSCTVEDIDTSENKI